MIEILMLIWFLCYLLLDKTLADAACSTLSLCAIGLCIKYASLTLVFLVVMLVQLARWAAHIFGW